MSLGGSASSTKLDGSPGTDQGARESGRVRGVLRSAGALSLRVAVGAYQDAVTTLFPADCRLCGGPLLSWGEILVCDRCAERAGRRQDGLLCGVCGEGLGLEGARSWAQFGVSGETARCTTCRRVPPEFARAVAWGGYEEELRELLQGLKYSHGMEKVAGLLGRLLAESMLLVEPDAARSVVAVVVPLAHGRRKKRGFNQVELLVKGALPVLRRRAPGWHVELLDGVMERSRETESQYGLTPRERRANVRGAFRVRDPEAVREREVVLVDDIYTTGATARECARVLVAAGANKVWVATLSRAQEERVGASKKTESVALWGVDDGRGS